MIDIDVSKIYEMSHGMTSGSRTTMRDTIGSGARGDVCRKLLEFMQAFENLRVSILSCGDCVRLKVNPSNGSLDLMSAAVVMASVVDATSDVRSVFIDSDDQMGIEDLIEQ